MPEKSSSDNTVIIKWSYTPPSFFEEPVKLKRDGYVIKIQDGQIEAEMKGSFFDSQEELRDTITKEMENYFLGSQLIRNVAFKISGGTINRYFTDGRKNVTLVIQSGKMEMKVGKVDIIHADANGVVHDSRKDRIANTQRLGELASKHVLTDTTARAILGSSKAAADNPNSELVHLFEVWETLKKLFGGEKNARDTLGISVAKRNRLGTLANDEPLNQGRHRGKHAGKLRNATADELNDARDIAREMIGAYLEHLEGCGQGDK